jgi:hypothetical protein
MRADNPIGPLTAVIVWAEMGDARRFRSSDDAARDAGLDVTVYSSDGRRSAGRAPGQPGTPAVALGTARGQVHAGRPSSPDHTCFQQVKARLGGQLALLSTAAKLARRCHHTLRILDDQALLAPRADPSIPDPSLPDHADVRARPAPDQSMNPAASSRNLVAASPRAGQLTLARGFHRGSASGPVPAGDRADHLTRGHVQLDSSLASW